MPTRCASAPRCRARRVRPRFVCALANGAPAARHELEARDGDVPRAVPLRRAAPGDGRPVLPRQPLASSTPSGPTCGSSSRAPRCWSSRAADRGLGAAPPHRDRARDVPGTVLVWLLDHIETWRVAPHPSDPAKCSFELDFYLPPDSTRTEHYWEKNWHQTITTVLTEDFPAMEGVQRGLASGVNTHFTVGRNERRSPRSSAPSGRHSPATPPECDDRHMSAASLTSPTSPPTGPSPSWRRPSAPCCGRLPPRPPTRSPWSRASPTRRPGAAGPTPSCSPRPRRPPGPSPSASPRASAWRCGRRTSPSGWSWSTPPRWPASCS